MLHHLADLRDMAVKVDAVIGSFDVWIEAGKGDGQRLVPSVSQFGRHRVVPPAAMTGASYQDEGRHTEILGMEAQIQRPRSADQPRLPAVEPAAGSQRSCAAVGRTRRACSIA